MRIIAKRTLITFWSRYSRAKGPLKAWHQEVIHADWTSASELKAQFRSASVLQGSRAVFNIAGNQYRLVVMINYAYRIVYIRLSAPIKTMARSMSTPSDGVQKP